MAVKIELVPIGPESQLFVVRLQQNDEVNELAPLSEAVAQHIADCLRIKLALDANTPLSDLALCRPMTEYEHMLDDLRSEILPDIMATLEAAAVEEAEGGNLHPEAGEASVDAPVAADGGSAVAGQQLSADASPKAAVPAETGAVAIVKQEAGSDQTEVHVQQQQQQQQLATACRGNEHPPASIAAAQQTQRQQRRQSPTTPAQLAALSSDDGGNAGGALHAAGRAASAQPAVTAHEKDELLARKLQAQLVAAERYGSRTRRDAAPAQGSLQLPTSRNWPSVDPAAPKAWTTARRQLAPEGRGSAPPLSPTSRGKARLGGAAGKGPGLEEGERGSGDGEEEEEEEEDAPGALPEFRGVVEGKLSGLSWLATLVAHLDAQELPVVGGKRWSGSVCECGSQKEAAVARDLALLWREQRLGFLGGDLAWQPEEYNFQLAGYHARVDVSPNLLRCRTLSDLRKLLASLHDAGTLADLAASLERNPLSCAAVQPTAEPYSAEATRKLRGVGASQSDKLPWRAWLALRPGQQVSLASFATAAQAAAAADMAVVWKQERHGKQGDLESQQYNFLLEWYRRDEAVWARLLAVDQEHDLRILFRKLRDCGWMERLVQQQKGAAPPPPLPPPQPQPPQQQPPLAGHSAELAAAAVTKPALRAKRKRAGGIAGSSAAQAAAERASGNNAMPGVAAAADKEAPAGKRNRVRKPATVPSAAPGKSRKTRPGVTASAAAGAAAGASGAADEPPDHVPLLTALSSAAKTPDGRAAGLSVELAATYLPALSTRSAAQQRQQIGCLQLLLGTREYAGVAAMLQAAIKIARLQ